MTTDFNSIMEGFVEATSKNGPEGGLRYLEAIKEKCDLNEWEKKSTDHLRTEAHNPATPEFGKMVQGIENSPYAYLTQDRFANEGSE